MCGDQQRRVAEKKKLKNARDLNPRRLPSRRADEVLVQVRAEIASLLFSSVSRFWFFFTKNVVKRNERGIFSVASFTRPLVFVAPNRGHRFQKPVLSLARRAVFCYSCSRTKEVDISSIIKSGTRRLFFIDMSYYSAISCFIFVKTS